MLSVAIFRRFFVTIGIQGDLATIYNTAVQILADAERSAIKAYIPNCERDGHNYLKTGRISCSSRETDYKRIWLRVCIFVVETGWSLYGGAV